MRLKRAVTAGATAIAALVLLTGCGEDDDPLADLGLPSASDMASLAALVDEHASCQDLEADPADWDYMKDEAKDPAWGIKERAHCFDDGGDDITLFLLNDVQKFQDQSAKAEKQWLIGSDFAVAPVSDETAQALAPSKMMFLSCQPGFTAPSGYKKIDGLADGCVMSNYIPLV